LIAVYAALLYGMPSERSEMAADEQDYGEEDGRGAP
jgi:hypothetical protein